MKRIDTFKLHLKEKRAIKVIAGIDNFDLENIKKVVSAADQAKASAVDISYGKEIFDLVSQIADLPVFVSSIVPQELLEAVEYGVDAIEIGNYDALYKKGTKISAERVLNIVNETLLLLSGREVFISVTVPGHIEVSEQIALANELEALGIDLIQTEGAATVTAQSPGARGLLETAQVSISNTIELARNTSIPVMCASGITTTTAPMAFAAGASAIGVGSCINKLDSVIAMIAVIRTLIEQTNSKQESDLLNV